jgi:hypothetical protein
MKKFLIVSSAVLLIGGTTGAFAQTSGDNPGGRGVTSTGGPKGVTGKNPDGTKARPVGTTGQSGMKNSGSAAGNSGNSMGGPNSANSNNPAAVDGRTGGGASGTGSAGGAAGGR